MIENYLCVVRKKNDDDDDDAEITYRFLLPLIVTINRNGIISNDYLDEATENDRVSFTDKQGLYYDFIIGRIYRTREPPPTSIIIVYGSSNTDTQPTIDFSQIVFINSRNNR